MQQHYSCSYRRVNYIHWLAMQVIEVSSLERLCSREWINLRFDRQIILSNIHVFFNYLSQFLRAGCLRFCLRSPFSFLKMCCFSLSYEHLLCLLIVLLITYVQCSQYKSWLSRIIAPDHNNKSNIRYHFGQNFHIAVSLMISSTDCDECGWFVICSLVEKMAHTSADGW